VYDSSKCEEGVFLDRLEEVGLLVILEKHHIELPPRALNAPPKEGGVRRG